MRVAVLGAGNGGQALSGDLALRGHEVSLFEHPSCAEAFAPVRESREIRLTGVIEGRGKLRRATTDPGEAVAGADVVFVVVPSFAQRPLLELVLPCVEPGARVLLVPGNFGSLEAYAMAAAGNLAVDPSHLGETDTLPYACRMTEPGVVNIWGVKKGFSGACLEGDASEGFVAALEGAVPIPLWPQRNVLQVAFSNMNMVAHCATLLLNVGRIEGVGSDFRFYTDGVTPSVGKLLEAVDAERVAVGKAYGLDLSSAQEWIRSVYTVDGTTLHELFANNPIYARHGADAPKGVHHRYATEDVPNLLVPVVDLGDTAGVATPVMDGLVAIYSALLDRDFHEEGRSRQRLGLGGLDREDIMRFVQYGKGGGV
ncbi:MAG: NAD/NADP octopine/nopaline dehydrogenase family protein [Synergistales bacterium]|nr:NAD/NADP octopine/nopaline dehydrogenase family protein [Synergistales bacterium]